MNNKKRKYSYQPYEKKKHCKEKKKLLEREIA